MLVYNQAAPPPKYLCLQNVMLLSQAFLVPIVEINNVLTKLVCIYKIYGICI